MICIIRV